MLSEYYLLIKSLHIHAASLSILLFLGRGLWQFWRPQDLKQLWIRILPHVVDTILLASAITLAILSSQYPIKDDWLTAKLIALVIYILLGTVAIKRGRTPAVRLAALVGALVTFGYILSVAITRDPFPFLG